MGEAVDFIRVGESDKEWIERLSAFASCIVKQHFDPIIGEAQNDYMIDKFQSVPAISGQIRNGYRYYLVTDGEGALLGFLAFYPREESMYLSKFYVDGKKEEEESPERCSSFWKRKPRKKICHPYF